MTFSNLQRFRIRKINQTGKYEADQTFHSANILVAPPSPRSHHAVVTPKSEPALEDPTEEKKILEWATKRDWEFLGDKEVRLTEEAAAEARIKRSRVVLFKEVEGWE